MLCVFSFSEWHLGELAYIVCVCAVQLCTYSTADACTPVFPLIHIASVNRGCVELLYIHPQRETNCTQYRGQIAYRRHEVLYDSPPLLHISLVFRKQKQNNKIHFFFFFTPD